MNRYFQISVGFWQSPKTRKTLKRLGLEGVRSIQVLWSWAAQNKPDGYLTGMDWEDIELAADWMGEDEAFYKFCLGTWIDETENGLYLHDWHEHNPWASEAMDRSDKARFSRLATTNRQAYEELRSKGVNAISKDEYEKITNVKRTSNERQTVEELPNHVPSTSTSTSTTYINSTNVLSSISGELDANEQPKQVELVPIHAPKENGAPKCPQQQILQVYREELPQLRQPRILRPNIQSSIKARWMEKFQEGKFTTAEEGVEYFRRVFQYVGKNSFLTGRKTHFKADLEWLVKAANWDKVTTGKYSGDDAR